MLTGILPEYVSDHIAKIHEHPLRGVFAFDAQGSLARLGQDPINVIGNGPGLPIGFCRSQHQIIGDGGQFPDMEDKDVYGLLVEHGPCYGKGCGLRCSCDRRPLFVQVMLKYIRFYGGRQQICHR